jgi:hypothetical protein
MDSMDVKVLDLLRGRKLCGQPRHAYEHTQHHRLHHQYDLVQEIRYQVLIQCMPRVWCDARVLAARSR